MGRGQGQTGTPTSPASTRSAAAAVATAQPTTHAVACREHQVIDVTFGVIDDNALVAFTGGQCHAMAQALHERTGWPLMGAYDEDGDASHFYVRHPDGSPVDITGKHSAESFQEGWLGDHEQITPGKMEGEWRSGGMREPDLPAARSFVQPLLDHIDSGELPFADPAGELPDVPRRLSDTLRVVDRNGEFVDVVPGELDRATRELLTGTHDHALARVLVYAASDAELEGATLAALIPTDDMSDDDAEDYDDPENGDGPLHYFAKLPDGRCVDINGVHTQAELIATYGGEIETMSFRQLREYGDEDLRPEPDDTMAQTFIGHVVASIRAAG